MNDKQKNVKDIADAADAVNTIELKKLLEELRNSSKKKKESLRDAVEYEDEFDEIICYGISFFKKKCLVKTQ